MYFIEEDQSFKDLCAKLEKDKLEVNVALVNDSIVNGTISKLGRDFFLLESDGRISYIPLDKVVMIEHKKNSGPLI